MPSSWPSCQGRCQRRCLQSRGGRIVTPLRSPVYALAALYELCRIHGAQRAMLPIRSGSCLGGTEEPSPAELEKSYQELAGAFPCLATCMRPRTSFVKRMLSRHVAARAVQHLVVCMTILKCLRKNAYLSFFCERERAVFELKDVHYLDVVDIRRCVTRYASLRRGVRELAVRTPDDLVALYSRGQFYRRHGGR